MPNAYSPAQVKSKLGWSNSFDRNAAFPLEFAAWFGSYEDAQAAAQTAVEVGSTDSKYYYGMQLYVFDGTTAKTYLIQGDKSLKEIGENTPMMFVDSEDDLYLLEDLEIGQQVLVEGTGEIWVFKGGVASEPSNWVQAGSGSDVVWQGTEDRVIFRAIAQSAFDSVDPKDANTLYFITDAGKIYKGSTDVTSCVTVGAIPAASAAVKGKLYIDSNTFAMAITMDGASWIQASPGYLTDGVEWAAADSSKLATIGLIKKGIQAAVDGIDTTTYFEKSTGTVKVGTEGTGAVLTGVAHDVKYDQAQLRITIPIYGGTDIVVDIPKDKFVTAGQFYEDYPAEGEPTHHNVIVLTIDGQVDPVIIPAEALVDVYTADNAGKDVTLVISEDNKISASVKIDPAGGNALVTSENGLKVDVSGKMDKIASATGTKIAMTKADGGVSESTYTITSDGEMGSESTVIPTANLIAAAISTAINNANISNKVDKVVGTVDNFVGFAAAGAIKDSGKKSGGATLAQSPDANTLATEAAVKAAVDNAHITWGTIE